MARVQVRIYRPADIADQPEDDWDDDAADTSAGSRPDDSGRVFIDNFFNVPEIISYVSTFYKSNEFVAVMPILAVYVPELRAGMDTADVVGLTGRDLSIYNTNRTTGAAEGNHAIVKHLDGIAGCNNIYEVAKVLAERFPARWTGGIAQWIDMVSKHKGGTTSAAALVRSGVCTSGLQLILPNACEKMLVPWSRCACSLLRRTAHAVLLHSGYGGSSSPGRNTAGSPAARAAASAAACWPQPGPQ